MKRNALGVIAGFGVLLTTSAAMAQPTDNPPNTTATTTTETTTTPLPPPTRPVVTTATTTTTETASAKKEDDGLTDHERVIGKFGVMYFGINDQPIGTGGPGAVAQNNVATPIIGARYWFKERIGLDLGLGLNFFSSGRKLETNNVETSVDGPAVIAFAVHAGVPLALAYGKHYKFLVIPELNVGYATQSESAQNVPPGAAAPPDIHRSGFRFDVGGRIGTEIQFGFIGVPQLALQASVGLNLRHQVWSASQDANPAAPASSSSISQTNFGTTVQADPWALFVNNISAIYYFP